MLSAAHVMNSSPYSLTPRSGSWVCGGVVASSNPDLAPADAGEGEGNRPRGGEPAAVTPTGVLFENPGQAGEGRGTGWSLRPSTLP